MKAVTITKTGPASVLEVREYPDPTPQPNEIRIRVAAAGLNFSDVSARIGFYPDAPPTPCVMGYEAAGIVDVVGAKVTRFKAGDRVLAMRKFGGQASLICVDERLAFKMPEAMTFAEGAAIPVNYLTAHHMLYRIGTIHPNTSVLVHMAAGGVGIAVLQLLSLVPNVRIFGTASAAKHNELRALGCTDPIDYRTQNYVDVVKAATNGRGVDVVLDPLGGESWKKSLELLAPAGRMVAYGFANAIDGDSRNLFRILSQVVQMPFFTPVDAMKRNVSMQGVNMGNLWSEIDVLAPQVERILELYAQGIVKPRVHAELPFSKAAEAHGMLENRLNVGKVVLTPD